MTTGRTQRAPEARLIQERWLKRKHGLSGPQARAVAAIAFGGDRRQ